MKQLGLILLLVLGISAQGSKWTRRETVIIAKKIWSIVENPGKAARQYVKIHPEYPKDFQFFNSLFQIKPSPQKVERFFNFKQGSKITQFYFPVDEVSFPRLFEVQ